MTRFSTGVRMWQQGTLNAYFAHWRGEQWVLSLDLWYLSGFSSRNFPNQNGIFLTWIWRHGFEVQQRVVCCTLLLDPRRLGRSGVETNGLPRRFCYFCCCAACALLCARPSERSFAENKGLLHFKQLQCCHEPSLILPDYATG